MPKTKRILLLIDTNFACFRRCIQGIAAFAHSAPEWILHTVEAQVPYAECIRACNPDAVIARYDPHVAELLRRKKIPVVYVYDGDAHVGVDNVEVGRFAARHLMNLGLRNFAFYGIDWPMLQARLSGFRSQLAEKGHVLEAVFWPQLKGRGMWPLKNPVLEKWLLNLPKPVGLFAANDLLAFEAVQRCRHIHIQVPEELAVLGVDNDEMLCAIASPEVSSIQTPDVLIGHTAASRLRRLLERPRRAGEPQEGIALPPTEVITRRSTDVIALGDADLAAALAYIRQHADTSIGVEEVLAKVGISRRSLEGKFKAALKRTPLEEIRRVHIERAKTLLLDWNLPVSAVAKNSGFDSADWMAEVFRRELGMTPLDYRRRNAIPVDGAPQSVACI